jgi:D-serine dehydratase
MLSEDGLEIFDLGINESISLHEELVTDDGAEFLDNHYDKLLEASHEEFFGKLKICE